MNAFLKLLFFLVFWVSGQLVSAQFQIHVATGISLMYTSNPVTNTNDGFISGIHAAVNGRFFKQRSFVQTGVILNVLNQTSLNRLSVFTEEPKIYLLKIPLLGGYQLIKSDDFVLRAMGGGVLGLTAKIEKNNLDLNSESIKDAQFGVKVGGGVDLGYLSVDVFFEKGLSAFYTAKDYTADFITISVGVSF